jgi:thiamine monophosphate kinase
MSKTRLLEFNEIQNLTAKMNRHPAQLNSLFASDSELLQISKKKFLSISTDGLAVEYEDAIYTEPEVLGWISVVMSLSDVACSGAQPTGLVLSVNWAKKMKPAFQKKFFQGVQASLEHHKTYLLGGDTGSSSQFSVVTTALAHGTGEPLQRKIMPGDSLACLTPFGLHAAYAFDFLMKTNFVEQKHLKPKIPFHQMRKMKFYLRGAIDNSDGLISTMAILSDLNQISFEMNLAEMIYHPMALRFCRRQKISPCALAWAELGGYELIVVVSQDHKKEFLKRFPESVLFAHAVRYQEKKQKIFKDHRKPKSYFQKMEHAVQRACSNF